MTQNRVQRKAFADELGQFSSGVSGQAGKRISGRTFVSIAAVLMMSCSMVADFGHHSFVSSAYAAGDKDDFMGGIFADRSKDEDDAPPKASGQKAEAPAQGAQDSPAPVASEPTPAVQPEPAPAASEPAPAVQPEPAPAASEPPPTVQPEPAPAVSEPAPAVQPEPAPAVSEPAPAVQPEPAPAVSEPAPAVQPEPAPAVQPEPVPQPAVSAPAVTVETVVEPGSVSPAAPAPASPSPSEPAAAPAAPPAAAPAAVSAPEPQKPEKTARERVREFFSSKQRTPEAAMELAAKINPLSKSDQDAVYRLWYYSVRQEHAAAYLPYAKALDPTQAPWGTIKKDPMEAWQYYKKANAIAELSMLKTWATQEAARGNRSARRLLKSLR